MRICLPIGLLASLFLVLLIWDLALQVLLMLSWMRLSRLLFLLWFNKIFFQQKKKKKKVLEIRGCHSVSSVGLSAIVMERRQLMVLDRKKCTNINDDRMILVAQFFKNLKQLQSVSFL